MILEYGIEQYNCLHGSWGKTNDGTETYWKCFKCGATQNLDGDLSSKTEPTKVSEYMKNIHSDPVGMFYGDLK